MRISARTSRLTEIIRTATRPSGVRPDPATSTSRAAADAARRRVLVASAATGSSRRVW